MCGEVCGAQVRPTNVCVPALRICVRVVVCRLWLSTLARSFAMRRGPKFEEVVESSHLDGKNVVFGKVIEGMEVVRRMQRVPTDADDVPTREVIIEDCGEVRNGFRPPSGTLAAGHQGFGIGGDDDDSD